MASIMTVITRNKASFKALLSSSNSNFEGLKCSPDYDGNLALRPSIMHVLATQCSQLRVLHLESFMTSDSHDDLKAAANICGPRLEELSLCHFKIGPTVSLLPELMNAHSFTGLRRLRLSVHCTAAFVSVAPLCLPLLDSLSLACAFKSAVAICIGCSALPTCLAGHTSLTTLAIRPCVRDFCKTPLLHPAIRRLALHLDGFKEVFPSLTLPHLQSLSVVGFALSPAFYTGMLTLAAQSPLVQHLTTRTDTWTSEEREHESAYLEQLGLRWPGLQSLTFSGHRPIRSEFMISKLSAAFPLLRSLISTVNLQTELTRRVEKEEEKKEKSLVPLPLQVLTTVMPNQRFFASFTARCPSLLALSITKVDTAIPQILSFLFSGLSSLLQLQLSFDHKGYSACPFPAAAMPLVNLKFLKLECWGCPDSADFLARLLPFCPGLESLDLGVFVSWGQYRDSDDEDEDEENDEEEEEEEDYKEKEQIKAKAEIARDLKDIRLLIDTIQHHAPASLRFISYDHMPQYVSDQFESSLLGWRPRLSFQVPAPVYAWS